KRPTSANAASSLAVKIELLTGCAGQLVNERSIWGQRANQISVKCERRLYTRIHEIKIDRADCVAAARNLDGVSARLRKCRGAGVKRIIAGISGRDLHSVGRKEGPGDQRIIGDQRIEKDSLPGGACERVE